MMFYVPNGHFRHFATYKPFLFVYFCYFPNKLYFASFFLTENSSEKTMKIAFFAVSRHLNVNAKAIKNALCGSPGSS